MLRRLEEVSDGISTIATSYRMGFVVQPRFASVMAHS